MTNSKDKYKLNIFQVLGKLNKKNYAFYSELSEEEQKAFHPLVIMRWLSGTPSPLQIMLLNQFVNSKIFDLTHHKLLLTQLMTICTGSSNARLKWIATQSQSSKQKKNTVAITVIKEYYGYSTKHAVDAYPLLSKDDILRYAGELGMQPDVVRKLKSELKNKT